MTSPVPADITPTARELALPPHVTMTSGVINCAIAGQLSHVFTARLETGGSVSRAPHSHQHVRSSCSVFLLPDTVRIESNGRLHTYDAFHTHGQKLVIVDHHTAFSFKVLAGPARIVCILIPRHALGATALAGLEGVTMLGLDTPLHMALASTLHSFGEIMSTSAFTAEDVDTLAAMYGPGIRAALLGERKRQLNSPASQDMPQLDRICRFIDKHLLSTELSPELIAGEFAMSRAALYRLFVPLGGVASYIRRERMGWAAARLAEEGAQAATVSRLARKLGFASSRGFEKAFMDIHGRGPRQ